MLFKQERKKVNLGVYLAMSGIDSILGFQDFRDYDFGKPEELKRQIDWQKYVRKAQIQRYGDCFAHATTGQAESQYMIENNVEGTTDLSVLWIDHWAKRFDRRPGINYEGSTLDGAATAMHDKGNLPEILWRYSAGRQGKPKGCGWKRALKEAKRHKIEQYSYQTLDEISMLVRLWWALHRGVVSIGMIVHQGWFEIKKDGTIPYPRPRVIIGGQLQGHAILAFNIDCDAEIVKIQNWWSGIPEHLKLSFDDLRDNLVSLLEITYQKRKE